MTTPRHPGSRLVDQRPNLLRVIRRLEAEVARLANRTRPETAAFVPVAGYAATAATLTDVLYYRFYRFGERVLADVVCKTGAGSVLEVRLTCPDLGIDGASVTTPTGGPHTVRLSLEMPETWLSGDAHEVYVQARRVSGTDATTIAVVRAWQR